MKLFIVLSITVAVALARPQQSYSPPSNTYQRPPLDDSDELSGSSGFVSQSFQDRDSEEDRRYALPQTGGFQNNRGLTQRGRPSTSQGFGGFNNQPSQGFRGTGGSAVFADDSFEDSRFQGPVIPILRLNSELPGDGTYSFDFETGDGIVREETGSPSGPAGTVVQQGSWSFTFPDGTPAEFSFVADENGYRVESPLLPVGPPLPAHALAQIAKAERERAAGIVHDGSYNYDHSAHHARNRAQADRDQQASRGSSTGFTGQSSRGRPSQVQVFRDDSDEDRSPYGYQ